MTSLTRVRNAQRKVVKVQQRLWLAEMLLWPTLVLTGVAVVGAVVAFVRRRNNSGRHELPETPGAHRAGADNATGNGQLTTP
jgi:mannose/fructose/N-acetylgalactosamine-specific phosphotransferase system component IIC